MVCSGGGARLDLSWMLDVNAKRGGMVPVMDKRPAFEFTEVSLTHAVEVEGFTMPREAPT
jgi:hypothetical protein